MQPKHNTSVPTLLFLRKPLHGFFVNRCTESTPHIFQHDFEARWNRVATGCFPVFSPLPPPAVIRRQKERGSTDCCTKT